MLGGLNDMCDMVAVLYNDMLIVIGCRLGICGEKCHSSGA